MAELQPIKKSMDEFAFNLYHEIARTANPTHSNIFLSPLSISSALLLAFVGSKTSTRTEIETALQIDKNFRSDESAVLKAYEDVLQIFVPSKDEQGQNAFELALANKAFIQQGFQLNQQYLATVTKSLHSDLGEVPFQSDQAASARTINSWVEQQTNSKIKDLISPDAITPDTLLVLVNAIYFKAQWMNKFNENDTTKEDFFNLDGKTSKVDLMFIGKKKYKYFDNDEVKLPLPSFQMIEIPYKSDEMSMLILLPRDKNGLHELESALTGEVLRNIYHASMQRKVDVWLPRFKLEETYSLVDVFKKMGMGKLFARDADFSGIVDSPPLVVSEIVHKAFIAVDEQGTEAAAATAVLMRKKRSVGEVEEPAKFRVDHPCLFAIAHRATGLFIFIGRLTTF